MTMPVEALQTAINTNRITVLKKRKLVANYCRIWYDKRANLFTTQYTQSAFGALCGGWVRLRNNVALIRACSAWFLSL